MNTFDLQIQSTASDGVHSPAEIVDMAAGLGIRTIAMTDHDTVGGVAEAVRRGEECGIRVIPGIEMSVEERGAHILGYGIDAANPVLLAELEKFRQGRIEGAKKMVENLRNAGFAVEWEDVMRESSGEVVARPHIARAVLRRSENKEKLGIVSNSHDFIDKYLSNESPSYVPRTHISAADAIALLHQAGAVAVWSHPAIHFGGDYEALEGFLHELIHAGIDGLEVLNPSHTEDDAEFIQGLAVKYSLLRTAGSDFHEKGNHPLHENGLHSARTLGDYETYGFSTDDMIGKLDEAIKKRREQITGGA